MPYLTIKDCLNGNRRLPYFTGAILMVWSPHYKHYRWQYDLGYINLTADRMRYMNDVLLHEDAYILDETKVFGTYDNL
jgi:hypothetical protein